MPGQILQLSHDILQLVLAIGYHRHYLTVALIPSKEASFPPSVIQITMAGSK